MLEHLYYLPQEQETPKNNVFLSSTLSWQWVVTTEQESTVTKGVLKRKCSNRLLCRSQTIMRSVVSLHDSVLITRIRTRVENHGSGTHVRNTSTASIAEESISATAEKPTKMQSADLLVQRDVFVSSPNNHQTKKKKKDRTNITEII